MNNLISNTSCRFNDYRPYPHSHVEYYGPWVENCFYIFYLLKRKNHTIPKDLIYLPIFWTDLNRENTDWDKLFKLIASQYGRTSKFFTVCQHDSGLPGPINKLDVVTFTPNTSGDYCIPLLKGDCLPYENRLCRNRKYKLNFMGSIQRSNDYKNIRSKAIQACKNLNGFIYGNKHYYESCHIITNSLFTLCPRGFGPTSFRLYEALMLGSIPIYIWDEIKCLPYEDEVNWCDFCIVLHASELKSIPNILESINRQRLDDYQSSAQKFVNKYLSYDKICKRIMKKLNNRL